MDRPDVQNLWQRAVNLLEGEMSEISLNTWIRPMEPVSAEQGVFLLSVPNDFHKTFVDQYIPLIRNTLKAAVSVDYDVKIIVVSPCRLCSCRGKAGRPQFQPAFPLRRFWAG